ncbi:heme-binding protein [Oceanicella sp. SM1341]|uniref:GlcG/HbpS family heme-binding protein n=1 Tax=Oceanicella sp. SM1341 TaxID=1548889 RepID=UPI000E4E566F|nr:heme-binding protein [Oceanicella sp. SM1341]
MPRTIETRTREEVGAMLALPGARAGRIGLAYCSAVVGAAARRVAFARRGGSQPGCIRRATDKAWSAAMVRQPTDAPGALGQPGAELFRIRHGHDGRVVVFGGGIPVMRDGRVTGAIGTSAGTVAQDVRVARPGIGAL